jgi:hypothetical protein
MEAENNNETSAADAAVNTSPSESPPASPTMLDREELRRKRSADYLDAGLVRDYAPLALVAAVATDVFDITSGIGAVIKQSLTESPPTLETVGRLEPALGGYYRGVKQLERLMQFEARTVAERTRAENMKMKLQLLALQDHLRDTAG